MSSDGDEVLCLSDGGNSEFSGFSPISADIDDTALVNSVKTVNTSEGKGSPKKKRGKSPIKGRKRVKSVVIQPKKHASKSAQKPTQSHKKPLSRIDINQLSEQDIYTLRTKLGISDKENDQYQEYVSDNEDADETAYSARPNLHVEVDCDDIDIEDGELPGPSRSKDLERQLFGPDSENEEWQPPKLKTMEKDKAVPKSLANLINMACTSQCDTENIVSKYKIPENIDRAGPPMVNSEVWKILDKTVHSRDRGISEVQNLVAAAMIPMVKLAETLKSNGATLNTGAKTLLSDSLTLLGQVQYNLSVRRRYNIRPHLKKKYFGLCNFSMPITSKLFGDDVAKEIKACEAVSYIGKEPYGGSYGQFKPAWRGGRGNSRPFRRGYGHPQYNQSSYGNRYQPYPNQIPRGGWSRSYRGRPGRRGAVSTSAHPNDN